MNLKADLIIETVIIHKVKQKKNNTPNLGTATNNHKFAEIN